MAQVIDGSPHEVWVPVTAVGATTIYMGQIVQTGTDGVITLGAASGIMDKSTKADYAGTLAGAKVPFGIVTGLSNPKYDSTYKRNKITSVITSNANYVETGTPCAEGSLGSRAEKQAMVKVALITPSTIIRAPIYLTSFGTAPTASTVTTAGSTGMGYTVGATIGFTSVASMTTAYCRSGNNKGIYRVTSDTSTTVKTTASPFPFAVAVGDVMVHVNFKPFGFTGLQLDSLGLFALADTTAANCFPVNVVSLNLKEAGKEYVDFMFCAQQFTVVDWLS
jgi:hypothetical protein